MLFRQIFLRELACLMLMVVIYALVRLGKRQQSAGMESNH